MVPILFSGHSGCFWNGPNLSNPSQLSAARSTSPITPTGTCKPSARAPSWCSRATTPATPTGWATRRRPRCGTTTPCAPTGEAPTRPWRGRRRRPTCCRQPTGMNFSSRLGEMEGARGHDVKETDASGDVSSDCRTLWAWSVWGFFFSRWSRTLDVLITQMLELAQQENDSRTVLTVTFLLQTFSKGRVYTDCLFATVCLSVCLMMFSCYMSSSFFFLTLVD